MASASQKEVINLIYNYSTVLNNYNITEYTIIIFKSQ